MPITLIPQETGKKESQSLQFLKKTFLPLLLVYIVFLVILGGVFLFTTLRVSTLRQQQEGITADIGRYKDSEEKLVLLKDRLSTLGELQARGISFRQMLGTANSLVGSGQIATILEVSTSGEQTQLSISTLDTFGLQAFLETVLKSENVTSAILDNVTRFPDGSYVANLKMKVR